MKKIFFLIIASIFIFTATHAFAEDVKDDISIKAEVDRAFITIGERVNYRVTITHSSDIKITSPIKTDIARNFAVKDVKDFGPDEEEGKVIEGRNYVITCYALGEYVIDGASVKYLTSDGQEKEITGDKLYVTVESIDKNGKEKTDIRGIKGVLNLKKNYVWLFILMGLAFLSAIFVFIRNRLLKKPEKEKTEIILSSHDEALQALTRLFDSTLLREGKIKEYYTELSDIIRRYIERRYGISTFERTTFEIISSFKKNKIDTGVIDMVENLLLECDLVKFAKYIPELAEIKSINQKAKDFVLKTKEEPKEETELKETQKQ